MFSILQAIILTIVALVLARLLERASVTGPEKPKDQAKNPDPSDAEVVPDGSGHKPVNRIKKYRF